MDNTPLVFCFGKRSWNRFFNACKAIGTDDQDIFYSAIFQFVQDWQPVFRTFIVTNRNRQDFLFPLRINAKNNIGCKLTNDSIIPHRIVDRIDVKDWIYLIQWAVLPIFNLRKYLIRHIGYETFWCFKTIDIFNRFRDLASGHSFGIHRDDLLINIRNIFLTLFHHLWFKGRFPILWDLDFHRAISAVYLLAFITVTIIVIVRTLGFLISKMVIHFSLHHFFNGAAQKIFECILDIFCGLDIVFLEKLADDVPFSFSHFNSVNWFLLFCHSKRPS